MFMSNIVYLVVKTTQCHDGEYDAKYIPAISVAFVKPFLECMIELQDMLCYVCPCRESGLQPKMRTRLMLVLHIIDILDLSYSQFTYLGNMPQQNS